MSEEISDALRSVKAGDRVQVRDAAGALHWMHATSGLVERRKTWPILWVTKDTLENVVPWPAYAVVAIKRRKADS